MLGAMEKDDRADAARAAIDLMNRAETVTPGAIKERIGDAASGAARDAVLGGIRALNDLTGGKSNRPRIGPSEAAVERAHAVLDAQSVAEFDERLRGAAARARPAAPDIDALEEEAFARLRRSFPPESRELATLLFACVDLLEDLAEIDTPPTAEALARKELLIARIGALLAPHADVALSSFVGHVVALSRHRRGG